MGNRLFQISAAVGLAIKNGQEYGFRDNGFMGGFKNFRYCSDAEIFGKQWVDAPENSFGYQEIVIKPGAHVNVLGYRQSKRYWEHCEDEIRRLFEFRDNLVEGSRAVLDSIRAKHPGRKLIGLHIRLGDYLNLKEHHTCLMETNYYFNAVNTANTHESVFVVFSNDVNGATVYLRKLNGQLSSLVYEVIPAGSAPQDLCTMSMCQGMIIANSSMSWFGAFLGEPHMEMILAPQKERWFGPAYADMEVNDIIPDRWRQIIC